MTPTQMEEYFADASDRLLRGEALEEIVVDYPASARQELQALLAVVELAEQLSAIAPPQRARVKHLAAHVEFSQRVAEKRAELAASQKPLSTPVRPGAPALPGRVAELWRRLTSGWPLLRASSPVMRLAPLALLLSILYLSTFTVVATAQAALPGDFAYPIKSWMREQRVATAPTAQQPAERWRADQEQAEDVAARAEQLQSEPDAAPLTAVSILQFRGFDGDQLLLGDLKVIPWYRPDDSDTDEWLPITIDGELQPGAVVMLRYQIVPGASDAVQGIALSVMQAPPMPTPAPTATPAAARHCQRIQAPNWVAYVVKAGDTLSTIAARAQTSSAELRRVNCLTDGVLRAGTTIFVPATILGALPPAPPPAVVTAIATQPPLPTATLPAPTVTPSPPTSAPMLTPTGTEIRGGGAEATPTATPGDVTATIAPTISATAEATPESTTAPTTPPASETAAPTTPVATAAPPTSDPAVTATELPATATGVATELPATATSVATESALTPTTLPPTELPATATSVAPDSAPTPTAPPPTVAPAAQNTAAPTPTAPPPTVAPPTATPIPPTPIPPTPIPPTPIPPTPIPPTPIPPTPIPPTPIPPTPTDAPAGDVNPAETP